MLAEMLTGAAKAGQRAAGSPGAGLGSIPPGFLGLFGRGGGPPNLPEEPDRPRRRPSDGRYLVQFLLGLCSGLLIAYLIYHAGGAG